MFSFVVFIGCIYTFISPNFTVFVSSLTLLSLYFLRIDFVLFFDDELESPVLFEDPRIEDRL